VDQVGAPALRENPSATAILTDFDGTLSAIVRHPLDAAPLPGAIEVLSDLSVAYGRVAVISGRPVRYLIEQLHAVEGPVVLSGLYGLEEAQRPPGGGWEVTERPEASEWRSAVEEVAGRAEAELPAEVYVERKGLSTTLHWRVHPDTARPAREWAERTAAETGLALHNGKASVELRPPVQRDKGTVVEELAGPFEAACFLGDDLGDLPAFEALRRLDATTVAVGVKSAEVDPRVIAAADVVVDGPEGALEFLRQLL